MLLFILGLILFFSLHMLPFYPEYRAQLIEKLDNDTIDAEGMYKIIFSVISLVGLIFVGIGKGSMEFIGLWDTPRIFSIYRCYFNPDVIYFDGRCLYAE